MSPRARIMTDNICQNGFGTSVAHKTYRFATHNKQNTNYKLKT